MIRRIVGLAMIVGLALVATGCNTIEGAGKDIKAAGSTVEKAANKAKPY